MEQLTMLKNCLDCGCFVLCTKERCDCCELLKEARENPLYLDYWGNRPKGRALQIDYNIYSPYPRKIRGCLGKYQRCKHDWPPEPWKLDGVFAVFRCSWCHKEITYERHKILDYCGPDAA